ncbi:MAG: archease [Actinobacteria bacterium]|nr:archease [Actinomycetota bacterium]
MGTFKILDHTADVGFSVKAASLTDLFETAAQAMFSVEYDLSTVGFEREIPLEAEADDIEGLLVSWLSELLFLHDADGFVGGDFIVVELGDTPMRRTGAPAMKIRGTVRGRTIGDWFEQTGPQIKAVTMHGLEVVKKRFRYEATVYLDV